MKDMKRMIIDVVKKKGNGVSFMDLENAIEGFKGNFSLEIGNKNIFAWFDCSYEAVEAINELINEKILELNPTSAFLYYTEGSAPSFPIAQKYENYIHKTWLPMLLNKGPNFV